jgi:prevent-host-death family protein
MNTEIGSYEAKTKLPEILRRVEAGERFTLTNRGRPIADLVPHSAAQSENTAGIIEQILNAKKPVMADDHLQSLRTTGRK